MSEGCLLRTSCERVLPYCAYRRRSPSPSRLSGAPSAAPCPASPWSSPCPPSSCCRGLGRQSQCCSSRRKCWFESLQHYLKLDRNRKSMMSILTCLHDGVALGNDLAIGQLVPGDRNARGRQNYRLEHAELAHRLAGWQDGQAGGVGLQLAGGNEYLFQKVGSMCCHDLPRSRTTGIACQSGSLPTSRLGGIWYILNCLAGFPPRNSCLFVYRYASLRHRQVTQLPENDEASLGVRRSANETGRKLQSRRNWARRIPCMFREYSSHKLPIKQLSI